MVQIREIIANKNNFGGIRNSIKYIVTHYTANDGDTAENNGKYFKNNVTGTSAHYFVDDAEIIRSVPDKYVAWSVGGKNYGGRLNGIATNANTINIELCDTVRNGTIAPTHHTIENALELVRFLMREYNIPQDHVIRHYDVTKKACPAYWVNDARWKAEFWNLIPKSRVVEYEPIACEENAVYRLYDGNSGEHFYTANASEGNNLLSIGWTYEGVAWKFPEYAITPIYRLYNPNNGFHMFTESSMERISLIGRGWKDERTAFPAGGDNNVYRLHKDGHHLFTESIAEKNNLVKSGWSYEGISWNCV